jgi:hypothetical protein
MKSLSDAITFGKAPHAKITPLFGIKNIKN